MTTTSGSPIVVASSAGALPASPGDRRDLHRAGRTARRRAARVLAGSVLVGAVVATGLGGIGPAQAGEPDRSDRPLQVRLCDPSGCLVAADVVDSDGDGVSDADELVAGTDPYRADSTPQLRDLVELSGDRRLASFEAGRSVFVVLPAELVAMGEKAAGDRLAAYDLEGFALPARGDALKRLGIDEGQMKELGIDPARSGMTIGLDANRKEDSGLPARRVGGIDLRLISDDEGGQGAATTVPTPPTSGVTPSSGVTPTSGVTPSSGVTPTTGSKDGSDDDDELVGLTGLVNGGTKWSGTIDGVKITLYNDGSAIGQGKNWGYSVNKEGTYTTWFIQWDEEQKDPDATTPEGPSPEQIEAVGRKLGSVTRTVEGWRGVDAGDAPPTRNGTLVAYVESGTGLDTVIVFGDPHVTAAQPESRPDLPNPGLAGPKGTGGGAGSCGKPVCTD